MTVASRMRRLSRVGVLIALSAAFALTGSAASSVARAQSPDCDQLRDAITVASRGDPVRAAQFARALQRQQSELQRTQDYADQIGCEGGGIDVFGSGTPPQCDGIHAQIERMTSNLGALRAQVDVLQRGDPDRQANLSAQYQASCSQGDSNATTGYDVDPSHPNDEVMRPEGVDPDQVQPSDDAPRRGGGKAICVRTCDGGFFPLTYAGAQRDLGGLQNLCTALCPNTEAKLYTTPDTDNIGAAVSADGKPYTDLPTAFKYQKTFVSTCSCKPPNKSWVEALADAEKLLGNAGREDITVTAKMSDDMARPTSATPAPTPKGKAAKARKKAKLDQQVDAQNALGVLGAQAPTAGTESAGIVKLSGSEPPTLRTDEGPMQTVPGANGATRRVRIIAPKP